MPKRNFKYRYAVGLDYQEKFDAPLITVKGESFKADEIVRIANRLGVQVVENKAIASGLKDCSIDTAIPHDFFQAVALLLDEIDKTCNKKNKF